ncbi:hypothetical protein GS934_15920, partial [Rhodococcus hoagii]|nr:hypothetical protein [Prescottella equi]NKZ88105.1 hypothetical protein [Prescottella equi]
PVFAVELRNLMLRANERGLWPGGSDRISDMPTTRPNGSLAGGSPPTTSRAMLLRGAVGMGGRRPPRRRSTPP